MKVNLGCGLAYVPGWTNVDASDDVKADIHLDAASFIERHGHDATEMYMGHFLEHLMPAAARNLLELAVDSLPEGAEVSAVVPDIRQIFLAYESGEVGNRELNEWYIYSYIQPSHHLWCYDEESLADLFRTSGFDDVVPIDPATWPPVWHKEGAGARFQSGVRGVVPSRTNRVSDNGAAREPTKVADRAAQETSLTTSDVASDAHDETTEQRVERLTRMVGVEGHLRYTAEADRAAAERELAQVRSEIDAIRRSRAFRLASAGRDIVRRAVPAGSARARAAGSLARRLPVRAGKRGVRG